MLDLTSLKGAIDSLQRSVNVFERKKCQKNTEMDELETIQAGVVQNFEFTYELCWKFIKRWLDMNLSPRMMEGVTRKQLFRYAAENFLIEDFDSWITYHELRNKTSHIYDSKLVEGFFDSTDLFIEDAKKLLSALEVRND